MKRFRYRSAVLFVLGLLTFAPHQARSAEPVTRAFAPVQRGFQPAAPEVASHAPDRLLVQLTEPAMRASNLRAGLGRLQAAPGAVTGLAAVDQVLSAMGASAVRGAYGAPRHRELGERLGVGRWLLVEGVASPVETRDRLARLPEVEAVSLDWVAFPAVVPPDPLHSIHWGHNNTAQMLSYNWANGNHETGSPVGTVGFDCNAHAAWDQPQGYGSSAVIIAIIDSGVEVGHPDLSQVAGYDYGDNDSNPDDNASPPAFGHGTACAGVAAAMANSLGSAGAAPGVRIMPLKVANSAGVMYFSAIQSALYHAADNDADIISMSLGAAISSDPATDTAINYAWNAGTGCTILAATGNGNKSTIEYPAIHPEVIGVGAASPCGDRKRSSSNSSEVNPGVSTDPNGYTCDGERWWGSNYGTTIPGAPGAVDVIAPTILPTTDILGSAGYHATDYYKWFNGTSCATPYAAGVCALMLSANPTWSATIIRDRLRASAQDVVNVEAGIGWDRYTGFGMVDLAEAVVTFTFTHDIPGMVAGSAAWGDYDNDGDLDILATGGSGTLQEMTPFAGIHNNNGSGTFTQASISLPGVASSAVAWGDYDRDGDLDFVLTGSDEDYQQLSLIYRNNGNGTFTDIGAGLPGVSNGSVAWGDGDGDGDLDLVLAGLSGASRIARVYRNDNGTFVDNNAGLPGVSGSSSKLGDVDNDGDLDLLLTGHDGSGPIARVYKNNGSGVFPVFIAGLPGVHSCENGWADYDGDGYLDVLVAGSDATGNPITELYRNGGNSTFSLVTTAVFSQKLHEGSASWGDWDADGRPDIMIVGSNYHRIFRNNGNHTFTMTDFQPQGMTYGAGSWGDADGDRDLDQIGMGMNYNQDFYTWIWKNRTTNVNDAPSPPSGLWGYKIPGTNQLVLTWGPSTDGSETPPGGLSYNLRVGTTPGGSQIIAPMATSSGYRRVPAIGNAQKRTTWTVTVPAASMYYFSVQAIDASFTGSAFSSEQAVTPTLWGAGATGVPVATFPENITVTDVQVISDGVDGVYVLWRDNRNGSANFNIFLQHLNASGGFPTGWSVTPLAVCAADHDQCDPTMSRDNGTGVLITWADRRNNSHYDIYAQYITAGGQRASAQWPVDGKAICQAALDQRYPKITNITTGAALGWADHRNNRVDLYVRRVNSYAALGWVADGVSPPGGSYLTSSTQPLADFSITSDGAGGAVVAWRRDLPDGDLMVQRMRASDGAPQWAQTVHATSTARVQIKRTLSGEYDLSYSKGGAGAEDLYYERLSSGGAVNALRTVAAATNAQKPALMVTEPTGGTMLGWYDTRSGASTDLIYAHRIWGNTQLSTCWPANGAQVTPVDAVVDPDGLPDVTSDLHGGILAAYNNANNAYVRHTRENGTADPAFGGNGARLTQVPNSQQQPAITTRQLGNVVGAWIDTRAGASNPAVYANDLPYGVLTEGAGVIDLAVQLEAGYGVAVQWTEPGPDPTYGVPLFFEMRTGGKTDGIVAASGTQGTPFCYVFSLSPCSFHYLDIRVVYACGMSWVSSVPAGTECDEMSFPECSFARALPRETDADGVLTFGWAGFGPNPASGGTWAMYGVPDDLAGQPLEVACFDVAGRRLGVLASGVAAAGKHRVELNARTLSGLRSRVIYLRVRVGDRQLTRSVVFTD